jgi:hypothetical protein
MENLFLFAIFTTILFVLFKLVEMKYLEKEFKPLKYIVRDAVIVFTSSLGAAYGFFYTKGSINDFFNIVTENKTLNMEAAQIFTDTPGF